MITFIVIALLAIPWTRGIFIGLLRGIFTFLLAVMLSGRGR